MPNLSSLASTTPQATLPRDPKIRIQELLNKGRAGTITPPEEAELGRLLQTTPTAPGPQGGPPVPTPPAPKPGLAALGPGGGPQVGAAAPSGLLGPPVPASPNTGALSSLAPQVRTAGAPGAVSQTPLSKIATPPPPPTGPEPKAQDPTELPPNVMDEKGNIKWLALLAPLLGAGAGAAFGGKRGAALGALGGAQATTTFTQGVERQQVRADAAFEKEQERASREKIAGLRASGRSTASADKAKVAEGKQQILNLGMEGAVTVGGKPTQAAQAIIDKYGQEAWTQAFAEFKKEGVAQFEAGQTKFTESLAKVDALKKGQVEDVRAEKRLQIAEEGLDLRKTAAEDEEVVVDEGILKLIMADPSLLLALTGEERLAYMAAYAEKDGDAKRIREKPEKMPKEESIHKIAERTVDSYFNMQYGKDGKPTTESTKARNDAVEDEKDRLREVFRSQIEGTEVPPMPEVVPPAGTDVVPGLGGVPPPPPAASEDVENAVRIMTGMAPEEQERLIRESKDLDATEKAEVRKRLGLPEPAGETLPGAPRQAGFGQEIGQGLGNLGRGLRKAISTATQ